MTPDQLRTALRELNGQRDLSIAFEGIYPAGSGGLNNALLDIHNAMLIPDEPDHLVKVTDGKSVFIVDAERVAWIKNPALVNPHPPHTHAPHDTLKLES